MVSPEELGRIVGIDPTHRKRMQTMADYPQAKQDSFTYEDYKHFPDELRCEIIDGRIYDMTPAPSVKHQKITGLIYLRIMNHLEANAGRCEVFIAATDVILADDQIVQPDVFIVCDKTKIHSHAIIGAPDVVFEILSPSTGEKDRNKKMKLYRKFGVSEYFLVDTESELVEKYGFSQELTGFTVYEGEEAFSIDAIGLELAAKDFFPGESP